MSQWGHFGKQVSYPVCEVVITSPRHIRTGASFTNTPFPAHEKQRV